ncbi:MAG TPA: GDSL-type esterase/lipase family protein [Mycobacteriales bacterium]|jgi:lysophospholipase L1-like esterase|nr:GDSL-type esterase/lipase family protein [Mycobacteriales bacterium]
MVRPFLALLIAATTAASAVVAAAPAQAAPPAGPSAIVALGDSVASGEAAGAYEAGTDQAGNFCHRSARAYIRVTPIAVDRRYNLACSGATTANVALNGTARYGEAPQVQRLAAIAARTRVRLVTLTVGANDIGFADLVLDCVRAYFLLAPRCQDTWASRFPARLAATAPRIRANLADIRTVMRGAGYADSDYQLVLQSYSSPVTEDNRYLFTRAFEGCPHRLDDAQWTRNSVIGQFTATFGQVAAQAGVRFLDMGPALRGREVCARGIRHRAEWVRGLTIDAAQIQNGLGGNLVQQSLHPNATGHAQFGLCLASFAAQTVSDARCVRQADGTLAAVPSPVSALAAAPRTAPYPVIAEPPLYDRETAYRLERQR